MKQLVFLTIYLLIGCQSINNNLNDKYEFKSVLITNITEYSYCFGIKAVENNKEILIISLKEKYYKKNGYDVPSLLKSNPISVNKKYSFNLLPIKPQVAKMEKLGAYIIVEKDTLYKADSYKKIPSTYSSTNSIGLSIQEK